MHKSFFPLFTISLIGVLFACYFQNKEGLFQYSGLVAGISPLVIYHLILLRKRLLSTTEVDSVYYFGFLVTVVTLVATAISIGISRDSIELRWVLLQFGLGLVTTGYALFARLHLLAKSSTQVETDIVESTEKLAESVRKVAGEFDKAGYHVSAFIEQTEDRLVNLELHLKTRFSEAENAFKQNLNEAMIAFNNNLANAVALSINHSANIINEATKGFSEAISAVMEEIGRVQDEAESISFSLASERIVKFAEEMEKAVASITDKVSEAAISSAEAIAELTSASRKTIKLATNISSKLDRLDNLDALVGSINTTSESLSGLMKTANEADKALSTITVTSELLSILAKTASEADESLSKLTGRTNKADQGLQEYLITPLTTSGFGEAIVTAQHIITKAGTAASSLLASIERSSIKASEMAPKLEQSIETAVASTASLGSRATSLSDSMSELKFSLQRSIEVLTGTVNSIGDYAPTAAKSLIDSASLLGDEAKEFATMLEGVHTEFKDAIASASSVLSSVESRLVAPLDELASSARIASQQIRAKTDSVTPINHNSRINF